MKHFVSATLLFFPTSLFAQTNPYNLLAPIGTVTQITTFEQYLGLVFQYMIGISALLAVLMLVICGIKMMTSEAIGSKSEAKACITNAIVGLLIAIGSWLLLNTLNPTLLSTTLEIGNAQPSALPSATPTARTEDLPKKPGWYFQYQDGANKLFFEAAPEGPSFAQRCEDQKTEYAKNYTVLPTTINGQSKECFEIKSEVLKQDAATSGSESEARNRICGQNDVNGCVSGTSNSNVFINKGACRDPRVYQAGCTSVAEIQQSAINALRALASASGCKVVITGGTESGHSTSGGTGNHAPGNATFDLRWGDPCLDRYIVTNGLSRNGGSTAGDQGVRSFSGNSRWFVNGFWYTDEKSGRPRHWHVCINGAAPSYCNNP